MKKQIYIAGPLFTSGDRYFLENVDRILVGMGYTTYLPHRDGGKYYRDMDMSLFYNKDTHAIDECEFIVAILNGTDVDSGTAWEIGYGVANGKKIIGVADDSRIGTDICKINLMIICSLIVMYYSVDEMEHKILQVLEGEKNGEKN